MANEVANVVQLDFTEIMKNSYIDYAMSVIISRALPDVRDGLKPVQRRILYAMNELSLSPDKPHRKSARIVGDTMGKYHPHGDSSIYDALVNMSKEYSLPVQLVDGHGNFGSIDGDGAAAMRYTEARLSKGAMALIEKLDKNLVEFMSNFDSSEKEPVVLPAMIPNLLINGATGIAVGMATNIPPHNPSEVIDGVIAYIDKPEITIKELMKYIKAPDFPTGGIISNEDVIESIYETGEGKIKIRAKINIENGENGRKNIIVTEIPYTIAGNKTKLVESIVTLMRDKVFDEIYDVRDESSKEGIRIVIEVKKDKNIENLLNGLYKKTLLEDTYGVNLLAVKNLQPVIFNLKGIIREFVQFQDELYTNEYKYLLNKESDRLETVKGLIRATDIIDLIIEILRGSSSIKMAKDCLMFGKTEGINFKSKKSEKEAGKLDFTGRQTDAILDMNLSRLIGLEILKLKSEEENLVNNIDKYNLILSNKKELYKIIKEELKKYKKVFSYGRKTKITKIENSDYIVLTKEEEVYVLIDKFGYAKTIDLVSYTRVAQDSLKEYTKIIPIMSTDKLCIFTNTGNMYQLKVSNIPKLKIKDKGTLIEILCKFSNEQVISYFKREEIINKKIMFATSLGYIKIVNGNEFDTIRSSISATKLEECDELVSAYEVNEENSNIVITTNDDFIMKFDINEVSELKKTSKGVKGITLQKNDKVKNVFILDDLQKEIDNDGVLISIDKLKNYKRGQKGTKINDKRIKKN